MNHPLKRVSRHDEAGDSDDMMEIYHRDGVLPVTSRTRQNYKPEEPASLARRYSARFEPVRAGNYEDFENEFDPQPYEWGSSSLRHRLRDGEHYRPVRRPADVRSGRGPAGSERDGFFGRLTLRQSFALAGLGAILAGGSIGLAATQINFHPEANPLAVEASHTADAVLNTATLSEPAQSATAQRKQILTASIEVSDVSGQTGQAIAFPLVVEPERAGQKLGIRLTGLPDGAYLTAGKRVAKNWILQPGQETGVQLVVPEAQAPQYQIEVAAIEPTSGQLAAPAKIMTLSLEIPPDASEPPAAQPSDMAAVKAPAEIVEALPEPVSGGGATKATAATDVKPAAAELIRKGDLLLKVGDLAAARQFYVEAFEQGAVEGAVGAAKSYDPAVYAELNVQGIEPDPGKALEWYEKAGAAGGNTADAVARLSKTP